MTERGILYCIILSPLIINIIYFIVREFKASAHNKEQYKKGYDWAIEIINLELRKIDGINNLVRHNNWTTGNDYYVEGIMKAIDETEESIWNGKA